MKKLLLVSLLAAFPMASIAATACDGTGAGTQITGVTNGTAFVRVTFTPVCSANTIVHFTQTSTVLYGGAGSTKGKNAFKGSTDGGSVKPHTADCGTDGCNGTEVDAAMAAAAPAGT